MVREAEADQEAAASGGNGPDPADLSDIDVEDSERDKRYLPFGGEAHVSAGGGGGSGNFLFDIIRVSIFTLFLTFFNRTRPILHCIQFDFRSK